MISRVAVAALALTACSSPATPLYSSGTPTQVLTTLDSAGIRDLRTVYRAAVCHRLDRLSPVLKEMYDKLAEIEPRNDGQLL